MYCCVSFSPPPKRCTRGTQTRSDLIPPHPKIGLQLDLEIECQSLVYICTCCHVPAHVGTCQQYASKCAYVSICKHMLAHASICQHMPANTRHMLANAGMSQHVLAYPGTCKHMLAYAYTCWHMLAYAICWHMLAYAGTQHMLAYAGIWKQLACVAHAKYMDCEHGYPDIPIYTG